MKLIFKKPFTICFAFIFFQVFFLVNSGAVSDAGKVSKSETPRAIKSNAGEVEGLAGDSAIPQPFPIATLVSDSRNAGAGIRQPHSTAEYHPKILDPEQLKNEVDHWKTRVEETIQDMDLGKKERVAADELYTELNALLFQKRERLFKTIQAPPDNNQKKPESKTEQLILKAAYQQWLNTVESEYKNMLALYDLRIRLIPEVTEKLRFHVTGVDITGVKELQGEIDHISLRSRIRSFYAPLAIRRLIDDIKLAPLPALGKLFVFLLAIILFSWWRKWADKGLTALRLKILEKYSKRRISFNAAWLLWYFERVRRPIEWIALLSIFFSLIDIPEAQDLDDILWNNVLWVLVTWFVILLINAVADRAAGGFKSNYSKLRLRSFRLIAGWLLVLALGLGIAEDFTGKGTLYVWIGMVFKGLLLPVLLLLINWWRPEIFKRIEREGVSSAWRQSIIKQQSGVVGYKNAAIGGAYLMIQHLRRQILRGITRFEGGRQLLANLTSREAVRTMESRRGLKNTTPIPEALCRRLLKEENHLFENIFENELSRLLELDRKGRGGFAIVIAERGGGKSSLLKRLQMKAEGRSLILDCPPGGYQAFIDILGSALKLNPETITPSEIEARLLELNIQLIGIDNLHRLSKPIMGGQQDLDRLAELYGEMGTNILWVIGYDLAAWQYIRRLRENRMNFDELIELPRWNEAQIRALVELRCTVVDLKPDFSHLVLPRQFDDIDHDNPESRNQTGFYRILWNAADGNPAVALRLWTKSLEVTQEGKYIVCLPIMPTLKELDRVNLSVLLVLRVITQSGMAVQEDIVNSLKLPRAEVANAIRFAKKSVWIEEVNGFYRITWQWFRPISRVLARQNLLARKFVGNLK